jgi:hypothetical protein
MKQASIITIIFGLLITPCLAQGTRKVNNPKHKIITSSEVSSKVTIEYSSVALFKTASRKKEYRIGESISIDLAMLNKSKEPIYFLDLGMWSHILVKDSNGNGVKAGNYIHPLIGPKFTLVGSNDYDSSSFLYVIGCEDIRKEDLYNADSNFSVSLEKRFIDNRFVNLGKGCIEISKPGNYIIKAEIYNTFTEKDETKKTVVGRMESEPLEITIVE